MRMNSRNRYSGIFLFSLMPLLQASCAKSETVLIVGDPYIETIYGGNWYGEQTFFRLKIKLKGYRIAHALADRENRLIDILDNLDNSADIVILSPWNADSIVELPPSDTKFIIAGGLYNSISNHRVVSLIPDRIPIIEQFGIIASKISFESGKPAIAVFDASSEVQLGEIDALVNAFGAGGELIVININEKEYRDLPSRFGEVFKEAGVLLLFAGPANYRAIEASENQLLPVFTESLGASKAWKYRIIASVEDNLKVLDRAVLKTLKSENPNGIIYYTAHLQKGDLYKQFVR